MTDKNEQKVANGSSSSLLEEEQKHADFHFNEAKKWARTQLLAMGAVIVAGAITTFSGTPAAEGTFAQEPMVILLMGIVTAVGGAANLGQISKRIAKNRSKAYFHLSMVTGLNSKTLDEATVGRMVTHYFQGVSQAEGA